MRARATSPAMMFSITSASQGRTGTTGLALDGRLMSLDSILTGGGSGPGRLHGGLVGDRGCARGNGRRVVSRETADPSSRGPRRRARGSPRSASCLRALPLELRIRRNPGQPGSRLLTSTGTGSPASGRSPCHQVDVRQRSPLRAPRGPGPARPPSPRRPNLQHRRICRSPSTSASCAPTTCS